ncbi:hypothetical protein LEMLEM_LOCUS13981 [Lemmus lemmus]
MFCKYVANNIFKVTRLRVLSGEYFCPLWGEGGHQEPTCGLSHFLRALRLPFPGPSWVFSRSPQPCASVTVPIWKMKNIDFAFLFLSSF